MVLVREPRELTRGRLKEPVDDFCLLRRDSSLGKGVEIVSSPFSGLGRLPEGLVGVYTERGCVFLAGGPSFSCYSVFSALKGLTVSAAPRPGSADGVSTSAMKGDMSRSVMLSSASEIDTTEPSRSSLSISEAAVNVKHEFYQLRW